MEIDLKEILRYAGYKGNTPDEETLKIIEDLKAEALSLIKPKSVFKEVSFKKYEDKIIVEDSAEFKSKKLVSHLKNSDRLLLFAATLGTQADMMTRKYLHSNRAKAVLSQALLAAYCESYCDEICEKIANDEEKNGYYLRPRFSPGYADFDLKYQKKLFEIFDINKRIGVYLNDECLMIPTKSVTAFIGLTKDKDCSIKSCANCENIECEFRRE